MGRIAQRPGAHLAALLLVAFLAATLLYPIWLVVRVGFAEDPQAGTGWTLEHIRLLLADPDIVEGLSNAFISAVLTTTFAMLIGFPLALLLGRYRVPGGALINALVLAPLILPPFVGALGVRALLGREGSINALLGTEIDFLAMGGGEWMIDPRIVVIAVVQALGLYPIVFLNAASALANTDPAMDEAAEGLGAGFWTRLRRITLPAVRPGLFAGGSLVFVWSFTELGTPLMFDFTRITAVQIYAGIDSVENSARPFALTVILLIASVGLYLLGRVLARGGPSAGSTRATRATSGRELTPIWTTVAIIAAFGVAAVAALPHLAVILVSLTEPGSWYATVLPQSFTAEHYGVALGSPLAFGAIRNSLVLSLVAMTGALALGLIAAILIQRARVFGRSLIDGLFMLPLAVPGLIMAFGFVAMSLRWPFGDGPLGGFASVIGTEPNPLPLLAVAYAVRRLPYVLRSAVAGLEQTPVELEESAQNLGATRARVAWVITLPLITANLIAAGLLVFCFSMLEVSDSIVLAQRDADAPITKAILSLTYRLGEGPFVASALGVWAMALLGVGLLGASVMLGKKLGAVFRL